MKFEVKKVFKIIEFVQDKSCLSSTDLDYKMTMYSSTILLAITSVLVLVVIAEAKNKDGCNKVFHGCKRSRDSCECDKYTGCKDPFDFKTLKACQASMYNDPCNGHHTCYNGGWCLQRFDGGYACKCSGTGYYGDHCEKVCPRTEKGLEKIPKADYENAKACIY